MGPKTCWGIMPKRIITRAASRLTFLSTVTCVDVYRMLEFINAPTMRNFIRSCFENLTQLGFVEVTKLNLYSLLALLKVK